MYIIRHTYFYYWSIWGSIRDALLELEEISEDFKIKREAKCSITYELKDFEFILGVII